jgi:hypothetical protein
MLKKPAWLTSRSEHGLDYKGQAQVNDFFSAGDVKVCVTSESITALESGKAAMPAPPQTLHIWLLSLLFRA